MKNKSALLLLLLLPIFALSQKTAPVAGDAATIINLLKKDYSTVNPDSREEEFAADRGKIVGLFIAYLTEENKKDIAITPARVTEYDTAYSKYIRYKQELTSILNSKVSLDYGDLSSLEKKIYEAKQSYLTRKYNFDILVLDKLIATYGTGTNSNPFVVTLITNFKKKYELINGNKADYFIENNSAASIQKGLPLLGGSLGFNTADLVDGLSRFLAQRIKEELANYAMSKIQDYLNNPQPDNYCYELLALLPETTKYLKNFNTDLILNFPNQLKATIEQDMNGLLSNAAGLRYTPRFKKAIAADPNLGFAFEALELLPRLSEITSPIEYFEILDKSKTLNNWRLESAATKGQFNTAQAVKFFTMMAYSLTTIENAEQRFVTLDFIASYGSRDEYMMAYLGLLRQQEQKYYNITFKTDIVHQLEFNKLMGLTSDRNIQVFGLLRQSLSNMVQNTDKLYHVGTSIRKKNKNGEPIDFKEIHGFLNDILNFSEKTIDHSNALMAGIGEALMADTVAFPVTNLTFPETFKSYLQVARTANDMVLDLHQKKFSAAINRALDIPLQMKPANIENTALISFLEHKELARLSSLFAVKFPVEVADKAKVIETLQANNSFLELYSLKLEEVKALKTTREKLDKVVKAIDLLNANNLDGLDSLIVAVKTSINNKNVTALLLLSGIDTDQLFKRMDKRWETAGVDGVTRKFLRDKAEQYIEYSFNQLVLNDNANDAARQSAGELLQEFAVAQNTAGSVDNTTLRIINFISDIAVSEAPEDIQKAIESFALPVGSSSLKEKTRSYFSINAYPGILGGGEYTQDASNAGFIGFTAPVGFYYQPFLSGKKGGSLGFFFPLIDIAAPVRFRLDSDKDNESLPDYEVKDIFAPGIYLTYGFRKAPFAINFGVQYGPKLRDDFGTRDSYRVGLGLVIDIPLLTLSNKYID